MKRQQEEEKEDFTLEVPDEILWLIFQYVGTLWFIKYGSRVCKAWSRVVRNECVCIDEPYVGLEAYELQRVPNLRTLKVWPCIGSRSEGLTSLTALTTLHLDDVGHDATSQYVLTKLQSLVNLTAFGMHHIVPSMMTNLRTLDLSHNQAVTNETITALTGLRELRLISCRNLSVVCVSTLTRLRRLAISGSGMTDAALWHLTNLTSLRLPFAHNVTNHSLSRLTQLNDLTLVTSSPYITKDDLLGLHLLTRLSMNDQTINFDYSPFTRLKCLEYYCLFRNSSLNERNYHLLTNLVTLKCNDHLNLTPEWIKKVPHLRELSVGLLMLAPHGVHADLSQFTLLEGSMTRGGPKVSLLK